MALIPASNYVNVTPSVISAGGTALDLIGLMLTANTRVPIGTVQSFASQASVSAFFGPTAPEAALATNYFLGFDNSNKKPGALLFAQYPWTAPVSAYLRGASLSGLALSALQALSGTVIVTIDGVVKTASALSFTGVASFSAAAALIQTGLGAGSVTFDSVSGAFVIASTTTGVGSTMTFATGTLALALGLSQAAGAVTSQGAAIATPAAFMASVLAVTTNWATFMTVFEPVTADKIAFAAWVNGTIDDYVYEMWDTSVAPLGSSDTTSAGYQILQAGYSGVSMTASAGGAPVAAFQMGFAASLDFTQTEGRTNAAYRSQSGLVPDITNGQVAQNIEANGYNYYGRAATANQQFTFYYPGFITGPFKWKDTYLCEIWLNNQFQLAMMLLLTSERSIPYNADGKNEIEASLANVIAQALNFGAIRAGVTLSALQAAEVNASAGRKIDDVLNQRGWYLLVGDAIPQVRAARTSPPLTFWYMDGGSVQRLNLASIEVQ